MNTNIGIRRYLIVPLAATAAMLLVAGCGDQEKPKEKGFYTSGSRDADQRAQQRVSKDQQIRGQGQNGEKSSQSSQSSQTKKPLYDRLGGEQGLTAIVEDFVPRVLADPRVNWERKGVTQGGISLNRNKSVEWQATAGNVAELKRHLVQFFAVATGGPTRYDGREMGEAHKNMHISNAEFDASVGDLKATLDKLTVAIPDQKELLAIVESTRPQIAESR